MHATMQSSNDRQEGKSRISAAPDNSVAAAGSSMAAVGTVHQIQRQAAVAVAAKSPAAALQTAAFPSPKLACQVKNGDQLAVLVGRAPAVEHLGVGRRPVARRFHYEHRAGTGQAIAAAAANAHAAAANAAAAAAGGGI